MILAVAHFDYSFCFGMELSYHASDGYSLLLVASDKHARFTTATETEQF